MLHTSFNRKPITIKMIYLGFQVQWVLGIWVMIFGFFISYVLRSSGQDLSGLCVVFGFWQWLTSFVSLSEHLRDLLGSSTPRTSCSSMAAAMQATLIRGVGGGSSPSECVHKALVEHDSGRRCVRLWQGPKTTAVVS